MTPHITTVPSGSFEVPLVDLGAALSTDSADLAELAGELAQVARDVGFFLIRDPRIGPDVLEPVERSVRAFFSLPEEEKMEISMAKSTKHRGYFPIGEETPLGSAAHDIKEGFKMAPEVPWDDPLSSESDLYGPNAWPRRPVDFQDRIQGIFDELRRSAATIAGLFALEWDQARDYFDERTDRPLYQLRATRYPPQQATQIDDDDSIGCGTHKDQSVVTIIWQVDEPGLQMLTRSGEWIVMPVSPGTFACTLGYATEILTNGEWRAPPHRVINISGAERHTVSFFYDPNEDCVLEPLAPFVGPGKPARYATTTMGGRVRLSVETTYAYRAAKSVRQETPS